MNARSGFTAFAMFVLALGVNWGTAQAQTKWDFSTNAPEGEFVTINSRLFADEVKKATGGALELVVHTAGSLIKIPDALRAVSIGQVPMVELLLGTFGNEDPVFAADNLPFVAVGYDAAWRFYQAQKPALLKSMQKRGLRLLYSVPYPGQAIYTKVPLKSIEDLKGVKFRTFSPLTARLAELLGAIPTVIAQPEVPQAFATNTINAMITSSAGGAAMKSWEFLQNVYLTNAFHPKNGVIVNQRAFARLSKQQQQALVEASVTAEKRGWELSKVRDKNAIKMMADNGMVVRTPDAGMVAAFEKVGNKIAQEWEESAGADGQAILKRYRGK